MPYVSRAQAGYFHTHKAQLERQGVDVDEWDAATKGRSLPERASMKTHDVNLGKKGSFSVKEGGLHSMLGIPEDKKISKATEEKDAKNGGLLGRRAKSALGFRAMHHG